MVDLAILPSLTRTCTRRRAEMGSVTESRDVTDRRGSDGRLTVVLKVECS